MRWVALYLRAALRKLLNYPGTKRRRLPLVVERLHHPDFFFVNIGANDGVSNDPIYPFLRKYGWRGIAVEPLGYVCDELRRNYAQFEGVVVEQSAITSTPGPLYFVPPDATDATFIRQAGSLHRDYLEKTIALMRVHEFQGPVPEGLERSIRRVEVPCLTFEQLLAKHNVQQIDFLNIDTEGSDFEILMMIDLNRWRPSILCLETEGFSDAEKVRAMEVLRLSGYQYLEPFDFLSEVFVQSEHVVRLRRRQGPRLVHADDLDGVSQLASESTAAGNGTRPDGRASRKPSAGVRKGCWECRNESDSTDPMLWPCPR
jgi:FkbM family methyltransferase